MLETPNEIAMRMTYGGLITEMQSDDSDTSIEGQADQTHESESEPPFYARLLAAIVGGLLAALIFYWLR